MHIRVGTRGSKLALTQAKFVTEQIKAHYPEITFEVIPIKTTGDLLYNAALQDIGGKSLFLKEIEEQLLNKQIDIAVHSMKDVPAFLPEGLVIDCVLKREDARDAFLSIKTESLERLPPGSIVGTCSSRRKALIQRQYPKLKVQELRGNIDSRLKKLHNGDLDAILLAVAGLKRLRLESHISSILDISQFLPAIGQGVIGVECRQTDLSLIKILKAINHSPTFTALTAERSFLKKFNGDCSTPIAAYSTITGTTLSLRAAFLPPQTLKTWYTEKSGDVTEAEEIGQEAALEILHNL